MLVFSKMTKQYQLGEASVHALNDVSGQVHKGEMLALCGPSGSGKSTLLNILGMLDMAYQGQVLMDGKPYPQHARDAAALRRSQLGFVFQRFNLIPVLTATENVAYPLMLNGFDARAQRDKAREMLQKVGLDNFYDHRPDRLSGGQQQRVAIARALIHQPQLVIADEPTASLDSQTAHLVIQLMKSLGHEMGTTFVIATHDPRMAGQCDRTINLTDGCISQEEIRWAG
ncbi:Lipoprotein-releasing system ATP-binding protein LolD [Vibrio aerogenes CECT 7868]|uniref:Lipoprotein-releasing system ATP-binding protein LolD n=1 Tax=Vibrio aerogenes CECT 7868 TaxID=1216006 RepID=A0A1M5X8U4_9VIBR|nr:ABC transporter ATP-binding protein [Vibrio aerogenes]SHH96219.1 Lipoprotein-releasing system ATP-binding protein LolD [Vibrio aerogenes CECT 7868]